MLIGPNMITTISEGTWLEYVYLPTFMSEETLRRSNRVCISTSDCLMSRYKDPRKFNGIDSWNTKPFTITKSPTVIVPDKERRKKLRLQIALLWTAEQ